MSTKQAKVDELIDMIFESAFGVSDTASTLRGAQYTLSGLEWDELRAIHAGLCLLGDIGLTPGIDDGSYSLASSGTRDLAKTLAAQIEVKVLGAIGIASSGGND